MALFRNRLSGRGVYLFDEPEAALSPVRQIECLQSVREAEKRWDAQFVIATHSPFVMAYPGAPLLHLTLFGLMERSFQQTNIFRFSVNFTRPLRAS
ncbi:AAA family ATPase [Acetobacter senegalensis]|uniref:AAA family ATPase n=1 Tax=Acetobacter senegalensis TaxID=446692 RepID=UPI001EDA0CF5|nr:AAA family ATPase [Acetobacter senegalensis]MCG4260507.1 AAA family ATPase [Acetobacter senegalensis]